MSDIAIKVENLGKRYLVGHNAAQAERYTALRDVIARNTRSLARKTRDMFQGKPIFQGDEVEEFWALKEINFEIKQGDRVGIIGRNGAGKSTLLKILSRITEPTTGRVSINGRIASLLEVGTGFHPELTGRENIFLNGAILGMSRQEIRRKFDEIVDFAEVEKFLDTPVKRYSSGMYVRLAFAVAAHLEPEILVVDEVLAVGDVQFQKKSMGKMQDIACSGRTVLFVSHNLGSVQTLCDRAIYIASGELREDGKSATVIQNYLLGLNKKATKVFSFDNPDRKPKGLVWFTDGYILNANGQQTNYLIAGEKTEITFHYDSTEEIKDIQFIFTILNSGGLAVSNIHTGLKERPITKYPRKGIFFCELPKLSLAIDEYRIAAAIFMNGTRQDLISTAIQFSVVDSVFFGNSHVPERAYTTVYLDHNWRIEEECG